MVVMIYLFAGVIIVAAISFIFAPREQRYRYKRKTKIMTEAEEDLYKKLTQICCNRYIVFPQIHLSSLLEHKIWGQNWKAAFYHINGKSVDFVLVDKQTLKTVLAIELDDYTHQQRLRQVRDKEVEHIFCSAGVPLCRLSNTLYKTPKQIAIEIKKSLTSK